MSAVAGRYAKSLLELAEEQGVLDAVHGDMLVFAKLCKENREFRVVLSNPIVNHAKKLEILKAVFAEKAHSLTMAIFTIITRKNREAILFDISKEFHLQYNAKKGIEKATLTSSIELDKNQKEIFEKLVAEATGKKVEMEANVDADLIGGFILKVQDKQFDASVKTQLAKLGTMFKDNPYISKI